MTGGFPELLFVVPASFKLPIIGSFLMLHLLPWLTTFNIVGYINGREINIWNVGFRRYATHCILSSTYFVVLFVALCLAMPL